MQSFRSLFSKEVLDVISTSTADMGPFSLDSFKKNFLSASWQGIDTSRNSENQRVPSPILLYIANADGSHQKVETSAKLHRMQLREKRREMRAKELVQQNDDTILKLENAAIEEEKEA